MTDSDGFDTEAALDAVHNTQRANLIGNIVGHPHGSPTVRELEYMLPSLESTTIRRHLEVLQDVGIVEEHDGDESKYTFYRLTSHARDFFGERGIFDAGPYRNLYEQIAKTEEIEEIEEMSRPV